MRSCEAKIAQNAGDSFKQRMRIHLDEVLGKIGVVES